MPAENCDVKKCPMNRPNGQFRQCTIDIMSVVEGKCEFWEAYKVSEIFDNINMDIRQSYKCCECGVIVDVHDYDKSFPYPPSGWKSTLDNKMVLNGDKELWVCDECNEGNKDV